MQSRPGVARRSHPAESLTRSQTAQRVTTWRQRYDGHSMFDLKGDWARKGRVGSIDDIYLWTQHIAEAARHSETRTVRDRSRAAGAVVVVARGVAFTLMVDGGHLLLDGSRGRRSAVDLGSLVRDERRDLECAHSGREQNCSGASSFADHGDGHVKWTTYPSFIVETLRLNLAGRELHKVTVSTLDDHIRLALSAEHGLGGLSSSDDALVLHVGIPHGRTQRASGRRHLAIHGLSARVGWIDGTRGLDDKEVDALERSEQPLARREALRRIGEQLRRERKDAAGFKARAVEVLLGVQSLVGLRLHTLVGLGRGRHGVCRKRSECGEAEVVTLQAPEADGTAASGGIGGHSLESTLLARWRLEALKPLWLELQALAGPRAAELRASKGCCKLALAQSHSLSLSLALDLRRAGKGPLGCHAPLQAVRACRRKIEASRCDHQGAAWLSHPPARQLPPEPCAGQSIRALKLLRAVLAKVARLACPSIAITSPSTRCARGYAWR
ncbi:hypothetical protein L1887_61154 [Cichorium endivia]|nr:hypothetical protein L1887_61154 [Cichorium endivia]